MKVIQVIPQLDLAGAEVMCENLSLTLKKRGYNVIVISLYNKKTIITERLLKQGIEVKFLNKHNGMDLVVIKDLYKIFKKEKPDVVHTHINALQYVAIAKRLANVKTCIHTVHSIAEKEATKIRQKFYYIFFKYFGITPVALSAEIKDSIIKRYDLSTNDVPVIYNGINLKKCIPKTDYINKEELIFLHIGRFAEVKNHKKLIDAFSKVHKLLPNSKLKLVGNGPKYEEIIDQVKKLGIEDCVEFIGQKSNIFDILNESDVFILPSIYEGMPMTLIEAMGTGIPIIASNVGGIPSMLCNNENALLIRAEEEDIVKAMTSMNNIHLRSRLGKSAFERSKLFSAEHMTDKYIKVYTNLIMSEKDAR
ncbi:MULTISPECIES: glycosyltransferase [Enterococcus]|uniref:glycosyltransferase n=1 Tax=Enterococcus TaxID=1350 RepID=UPI000BBCCB6B|nr:glycosyltransferase [Enterococcus faecium]PCE02841.1 hypothetical protein CKY08_12175 [Enterococcus faecium]